MPSLPSPIPMQTFSSSGVDIAYLDVGEGEPTLLIHGFASTAHVNWVYPGWIDTLTAAGRRVIALDNRGHGASAKLYEPAAYHTGAMAEDARALLDHLDIGLADVIGYSMGARISAFLALTHPHLVRSAVLGGLGIKLVDGVGLPETIAEALEAASLDDVTDPQGRTFRAFAQQTRSDRLALAACIRGSRNLMSRDEARQIGCPVLVAIGTKDDIAGEAEPLVELLRQGEALAIPNRDHMTAVGDKVFKAGVLDFLSRRP
jgi:pimeloyl-ACP methyl ester carboxylesterase